MKQRPGQALAHKSPKDQIADLDRLVRFLQDAGDELHGMGQRDLAVMMGETARKVSGIVGAIRFRLDVEASCCVKKARGWECGCEGGMP